MSWMIFLMKSLSRALVFLFAVAAHGADTKITQAELARRTQELYDAIVPGKMFSGSKQSDPLLFFTTSQ